MRDVSAVTAVKGEEVRREMVELRRGLGELMLPEVEGSCCPEVDLC
jgi:hypothetical protein